MSGKPKVRPERIRVSISEDATGAVPIPLPSKGSRLAGVVVGAMFVVFAWIAATQISRIAGQEVDVVFDLVALLFQGFWVVGWSVAVLVLFLLTVLLLFYRESARVTPRALVHAPRLGPLRILLEYDVAKIRRPRAVKAKGAQARIRFDYGLGSVSLGNEIPRADAERGVEILRAAIGDVDPAVRRTALDDTDAGVQTADAEADATRRRHNATRAPRSRRGKPFTSSAPEFGAVSWTSPSALALIGANLVPLAGVLLLDWNLGEIMTLFWAENAVIGFYALLKLSVVARWGTLIVGPFFVGHYGGFMAGHFLFVYYLFVRGVEATGPEAGALVALSELFVPLWPALLALLISHGVSFRNNFLGREEHIGRTVGEQMGEPYKRIVVLHVTIILGGWLILLLKSPLPALVLLLALKTAVDLRAHRKEHGAATVETPLERRTPHPNMSSAPN